LHGGRASKSVAAYVTTLLVLVGLGQIALALVSLMLPRILRWREETARLSPLTRRIFWVYAGYILGTQPLPRHLVGDRAAVLLDRSPLARLTSGYATAYWECGW